MRAAQGPRGRGRGRRAGAVGLAVAAAGLAAAPSAHGGSYTVDVCRDGTTGAAVGSPSGLWVDYFAAVADECLSGGLLRGQLSRASLPAGDEAQFGFIIPSSSPSLHITRIHARYTALSPTGNAASVRLLSAGATLANDLTPNTVDLERVPPAGARDVLWRVTCASPGNACTYPGLTGALDLVKARFTVAEDADPTGQAAGGSLLGAGSQRGTRDVLVDASDADSGVRRITARLGATAVGELALACSTTDWAPCEKQLTGNARATVAVDTTRVPDGTHPLTLLIEDAARNTATVAAGSVVVDNVPPPDATRAPALAGSAVAGQALVADPGEWDGHGRPVSLELRWQRSTDGVSWVEAAAGPDPARYALGPADVGLRIRAVVRASSSEGSRDVVAGPTGPVATPPAGGGTAPGGGTGGDTSPGGGAGGGGSAAPVPNVVVLPPVGAPAGAAASAPGALNSGSGHPGARLIISVVDRRRAARIPYGSSVPISGILRDAAGRPVPGAHVEVVELPAGGGAARAVGTEVTDAAGRFSHRPRTGPSRTLRFAYRAHHGDVSLTSTQEVALRVVAGVALRTDRRSLRNRQRLTFRGTVRGTSGRKLVELQVRRGSTWMTFATTFTRRGAFSYRYRFMRTRTTARFQFRARVLKDTGFPYETGASRTVRVLVRGAR